MIFNYTYNLNYNLIIIMIFKINQYWLIIICEDAKEKKN